jgi:hypothetical protein
VADTDKYYVFTDNLEISGATGLVVSVLALGVSL